jgi:transcriptional regulator with XRE-family HTH domain
MSFGIVVTLCGGADGGTREGFILVSMATGNGDRPEDGAARRAELADFLRGRRAALRPEDVGLPGGGRRRTPGLRREEIAQLAGMGTTWYTWLEQAREVRASRSVLDSLADALRLTPAERAHLMLLGRGEEVAAEDMPRETVSDTLARLLDNLGASPAVILGRRWDFLTWNAAYAAVFGDPDDLPEGHRNHVWATFHDPARRRLFTDWEAGARSTVARFRADSARHVGDPRFDALIAELRATSPEFAAWWSRHEVALSGHGRKLLRHPVAGRLHFEHAVFKLEETPEQRLILYTPLPKGDTPARLARLLDGATAVAA